MVWKYQREYIVNDGMSSKSIYTKFVSYLGI